MAVNPATVIAALGATQLGISATKKLGPEAAHAAKAAHSAYKWGKHHAPNMKRVANNLVRKGHGSAAKYGRKLAGKFGHFSHHNYLTAHARKGLQKVGNTFASHHQHHIEATASSISKPAVRRHFHETMEHLNKNATNHIQSYKQIYG